MYHHGEQKGGGKIEAVKINSRQLRKVSKIQLASVCMAIACVRESNIEASAYDVIHA